MAYMQVAALLALLDEGTDPATVAEPFGAWCDHTIEPWVADHIAIDGGMVRRWQGDDLDLSRPLTSDLIAAAVEADPRIGQHAAGYFAMTALPETLRPAEPLARAVYQDGWRPSHTRRARRATSWWTSSARSPDNARSRQRSRGARSVRRHQRRTGPGRTATDSVARCRDEHDVSRYGERGCVRERADCARVSGVLRPSGWDCCSSGWRGNRDG